VCWWERKTVRISLLVKGGKEGGSAGDASTNERGGSPSADLSRASAGGRRAVPLLAVASKQGEKM